MVKHIGIVACSAEGAALCYRTICQEGAHLMGKYSHPEITMHTQPLSEYMRYIEASNWEGVADLMSSSAEKVARAGADFAICPDNTIHQAFDRAVEKSSIPWLHIAEVVVSEAKGKNYKCLGVLGTRWLMEGPVYPAKLEASELAHMIPEPEERRRINEVIFAELVKGRFTKDALAYFSGVISRLKNRGCDAVVLGCTEIPLLVTPETSPLPTLDSTKLLAKAALKKAMEEESP